MRELQRHATARIPSLALSMSLLLGPTAAFAQGTWMRIGDPPNPPVFNYHGAVYDSLGDRVLVYKPFAIVNGQPAAADEIWEYRLSEPTAGWHQLEVSGTGPGGRHAASLVFDEPGRRLLLYGGWVAFGDAPMTNDVYVLSLAGAPTWSVIHTTDNFLRVRLSAFVGLDQANRRLVLYGGRARFDDHYGPVYDLWTLPLDARAVWTEVPITGAVPPERSEAQLAWDPLRGRVLVHGGFNVRYEALGDTWALTVGATAHWDALATSGLQIPRGEGGALVDVAHDRLLLAPGFANLWPNPPTDRSVYELPLGPGGEWAEAAAADSFHTSAYVYQVVEDRRRQRLVTVGNLFTQAYAMSNGSGWARLWPPDPVAAPEATTGQVLVADPEHQAIWSVGGDEQCGFGDLWKLDATHDAQWSWYPQSHALPSTGHVAALDAAQRRVMVTSLMSAPREVIALGTDGAPTETVWAPRDTFPPMRVEYSAVVDPVRRRMIVFGGQIYMAHFYGYSYDDLWQVSLDDPSAWTPLLPAGPRPRERGGHFAFYDDAHDRMVVLGGWRQTGGPIRHDTPDNWALALAGNPVWTLLDSAAWTPPVRGSLTYDAVTQQIFLFHPAAAGFPFATQVYTRGTEDDDAWMPIATTGDAPEAYGAVAFAPWCDRLVVASTLRSGPQADETWALQLQPGLFARATLERVEATARHVALVWKLGRAPSTPLTISRREDETPWQIVARPLPDDRGRVEFEDVGAPAGVQLAYRLSAGTRTLSETTVRVPLPNSLSFSAARPSPARGMFTVAFALPEASPVSLELFDVHGARVLSRELGMQRPGEHVWAWPETAALRAGLYVARLSTRSGQRESKAVLLP
jgi:hypothetical protein